MMDDARTDHSMRGATAPHRGANGGGDQRSPAVDADELFRTLERATGAIAAYLRSQVSSTPYLALGAAALGGYVLGSGVSPRIAALLVSMAGRSALSELVAETLANRPPQA